MNTPKPFVIAIDGPAASGKGTLAKNLAATLGFAHLDTGTLYRAVAKMILDQGLADTDSDKAINIAAHFGQSIDIDMLDNPALKTDRVGSLASQIAQIQLVRDHLLDFQQNFASLPNPNYKGVVLDGRDTATVICPTAALKIYVTASDDVRAARRTSELQDRGIEANLKAVLADMKARDERDSVRLSPDLYHYIVDTSSLTRDETLGTVLHHVREKNNGTLDF